MKRVLILNGDSYVGVRVAQYFYNSGEYEVEVTLSRADDDLVTRSRRFEDRLDTDPEDVDEEKRRRNRQPQPLSVQDTLASLADAGQPTDSAKGGNTAARPSRMVPVELQPYVKAVVPWHNDDLEEFGRRLLANDIIVAVLENDCYEAECAIRILFGSHYEVEKTFVLVSSVLSWANTLEAERAKVRADRKRALDEERAAFLEEYGEDEEMPAELQAPEPAEEDPEELVPSRTFTEEEYAQRVPHPRFQHWKNVEHMTKFANSETLHTYVLFAGLPYGEGEGPLHNYLRAAWHHQSLPLYGPGDNHVPMIHVADLAQIIYKVGSNYDVLEERYMFAVDRGNLTQRQLLECLRARLGGRIVPQGPRSLRPADAVDMVRVQAAQLARPPTAAELEEHFGDVLWSQSGALLSLLTDIRAEPAAVLSYHEEEDWVAPDGLATCIDRVVFEFRKSRDVRPLRVMVTGPPLSGTETVGHAIADWYGVPCVTATGAIECYEAHVAHVRERLRALLVRRLERRRARRHAARAKAAREEQEAKARERAAARREEDGDEEAEEEGEEGEEGEEEDEEEQDNGVPAALDATSKPAAAAAGADAGADDDEADEVVSQLSAVFTEEGDLRPAAEVVDERYLLGFEEADDDEAAVEEMEDEAEEEELFFEEEPDEDGNGGITLAQLRARAAIRAADARELVELAELRQEYRLGLRVLSMKTTDGKLPRPPPEEDEEEEYEQVVAPAAAKGGGAGRRRGGGDDGDEEDEEGEEEEDEEEEGEEEEGGGGQQDGADGANGGSVANTDEGPAPPPPVVQYLDEALAFMVRWRLRQADCRNQGFVLRGFPRTVRQATLVFMADPDEEAELRARRVLPPPAPDDVPPPEDAGFPLFSPEEMDDDARAELERLLAADALPLPAHVSDAEEGVLAPVKEAFFPRQVLVLDERDAVLQSLAANLLDSVNVAVAQQAAQPPADRAGGGARAGGAEADDAGGPVQTVKHIRITEGEAANTAAVLTVRDGKVISRREEEGGDGAPRPSLGFSPPLGFTDRHPGFDLTAGSLTLTGTGGGASARAAAPERTYTARLAQEFLAMLERYRRHHDPKAPPTRSLLTWLQGVATAPEVGAVPDPIVLARRQPPDGAARDDDDGDDPYAMDEEAAAAALSRHAAISLLQPPTRDLATVTQELRGEEVRRARAAALHRLLPVPAALARGNTRYRYCDADRAPDESDYALGFLSAAGARKDAAGEAPSVAAFVSSARAELLPAAVHYGPPSDDSTQRHAIELAVEEEKQQLRELVAAEEGHSNRADEELAAALRQERFLLRRTQISEESLGAWRSAQMPMETYLMEYVVPSLTPALAEVVRLRPEDPINTLADILFNYKRRTQL